MKDSGAWDEWETKIDKSINLLDEWKPSAFLSTGKIIYDNAYEVIKKGLTVIYDSGSGTESIPNANKPYNEEIRLTSIIPVKFGEKFLWWEFDNSQYSSGMYIESSLNPCYCFDTVTFTAHYMDADVINYIAYNATNIPASHENNGELSSQVPKKNGYTFLGWDENKTAQMPTYKAGDSITETGDITLYAIWEAKTFNIIFDANGGIFADGSTATTKPKVYNADFVFDVTPPTRDGYTFLGWSLKNDNTVDWKDGEHTNDIGNATADDRRVYAIWADASATMVYDHGDWIVNPNNPDQSIVAHADPIEVNVENGTTYALIEPVINLYNGNSFKGWQYYHNGGSLLDANGYAYTLLDVGDTIELDPINDKENYVLAKWQYYVHYNSGTEMVHEQGVDDYVIKALASSNGEQVFKHWKSVDEKGNVTYYKVGETVDLSSDLTLNAVWGTEDTVSPIITVLTNKTTYKPGETADIEIMVDNSGYFRVDATDSSGFKLKNTEGSKKTSAVFVENTSASDADDFKCYNNGDGYTVKLYIPDNCSNGSYPINITVSNGIYDMASDGSMNGTETGADTETLMINVNNGEEEKEYYTLSYHMNDGYGSLPEPVRFYDGEEVRLDRASGFERDGYEFICWCENENGKGTKYKAGGYYSFDEDTLLYAVWEVDSDYEMPEELEMMIKLDRYSTKTDVSWYKPGATIGLRIDIDNSDHFFVDTRDCPNFTFSDANGNPNNAGTFYERNSPDYDGVQTTYTNGGVTYVSIKIPDNCRDGEYTIIVKGADSVIDQATGASNGNIITLGATVTVRKNELPDDIYLSKSEMILHKGNEKRLTAAMLPEYVLEGYHQSTGDLYVEWKTSNPKIASIDERGNRVDVIGESAGTAVITAYIDDISASCTITVVDCSYTVRDINEEYLASPATCTSQATYYYVCECGDVGTSTYKHGELASHNYSAWETIQKPTETTPGLEQRICSECHSIEGIAIPALGQIREDPVVVLVGDINGDSTVDIRDAQRLFQYSMLPNIYPIDYSGSVDFNGDGLIDIRDAQRLFQYSMLPDIYPIS